MLRCRASNTTQPGFAGRAPIRTPGSSNLPHLTRPSRREELRGSTGWRTTGRRRHPDKGFGRTAFHQDAPLPRFCSNPSLRTRHAAEGGRSSAIIRKITANMVPWNGRLRQLEGEVAATADDLRADSLSDGGSGSTCVTSGSFQRVR